MRAVGISSHCLVAAFVVRTCLTVAMGEWNGRFPVPAATQAACPSPGTPLHAHVVKAQAGVIALLRQGLPVDEPVMASFHRQWASTSHLNELAGVTIDTKSGRVTKLELSCHMLKPGLSAYL